MSWDAVARLYRAIEAVTFGTALQNARVAWLDGVRDARRALLVGEGDGRFLAALLRVAPDVRVDVVDGSAAMLALAKTRAPSDRVRFVQADIVTVAIDDRYDLVVTHFVLDCLSAVDVDAVVHKLAACLEPDGRWLLADFTIPSGALRGARARFWLAVMYRFFGVTAGLAVRELVDPTPLLEAEGLERVRHEVHDAGFISSALWRHAQAASSPTMRRSLSRTLSLRV